MKIIFLFRQTRRPTSKIQLDPDLIRDKKKSNHSTAYIIPRVDKIIREEFKNLFIPLGGDILKNRTKINICCRRVTSRIRILSNRVMAESAPFDQRENNETARF